MLSNSINDIEFVSAEYDTNFYNYSWYYNLINIYVLQWYTASYTIYCSHYMLTINYVVTSKAIDSQIILWSQIYGCRVLFTEILVHFTSFPNLCNDIKFRRKDLNKYLYWLNINYNFGLQQLINITSKYCYISHFDESLSACGNVDLWSYSFLIGFHKFKLP